MKSKKEITYIETIDGTVYSLGTQLILKKALLETCYLKPNLRVKFEKNTTKRDFEAKELDNNIIEISFASGRKELLYPSSIIKVIYKEVEEEEKENKFDYVWEIAPLPITNFQIPPTHYLDCLSKSYQIQKKRLQRKSGKITKRKRRN